MILGFKIRFKERILKKIKIHTLRDDPTNRWKAGAKLHAFIHARTKWMAKIFEGECISTQQILMVMNDDRLHVTVDRRRLNAKEIYCLAINDGFDDVADLISWFFPVKNSIRIRTMWTGKIIHWTDFKY